MKLTRGRIIQIVLVLIIQAITLMILPLIVSGFSYTTYRSLFVFAILISIAQSVFWWVFINLFSWLPVWLYPILTFVLNGGLIALVGNQIPGITIDGWVPGLWIALALTAVNAILGGLLSLDEDAQFDVNVTRAMVARRGKPIHTDQPGVLYLEIDGLGEAILRQAVRDGHMPNLKRWIDSGSHRVAGWETDFSSQTGAMQTGILLGNNTDVPAYRWWDRAQGKLVMSGLPKDAQAIEARLSSGKGLCSDGGASRGNMFSGDATESMLTFSTLMNSQRGRGPGFYFYLFSPYVVARLVTRYLTDVVREWIDAFKQRRRKDKYIISARNPGYAFLRAFMGPFLQDLITYTIISDVLRGLPAAYALYAGYDDLSHFAGMKSPESFESLHEIDRYFARIERALESAPRPYHIVVLADHGQSLGPTFKAAHGLSLEELVKGLIKGDAEIFASIDTNEAWDNLNAVLNESSSDQTRTARLMRRALASKAKDGVVNIGPEREKEQDVETKANAAKVVVLGSGCSGLIYFTESKERQTYEQIIDAHPDLVIGLLNHPGIGFVLVNSEKDGPIVLGKNGVHYLSDDHVDGVDPLAPFGPNAALHLRRESSFSNCPDLVVNTTYDPVTEELAGFENQVSHHGGIGGPQNHPFVLFPTVLPYDEQPIVGAEALYRLLRGWRDLMQA
jgi:putative membrane protein